MQRLQMADLNLQSQMVKTLLCYHPFWLKLGLELVLGKPQQLSSKRVPQWLQGVVRQQLFKEAGSRKAALHAQKWVSPHSGQHIYQM